MSPVLTATVVATTLVGVAVGRYPGLRMNRATIALVGATVLVLGGAISLERARAAVDLDTLALLFAMMVLAANLRLAGFFGLAASRLVAWARTPRQLLLATVVLSGSLAALVLNDTVALMLTPFLVEMTAALGLSPLPFLVALVTAANVGSLATLVGNPQNILIGASSGIPFTRFLAFEAPIAVVGLAVVWTVVAVVYRHELRGRALVAPIRATPVVRPLLRKSVTALAALVVLLVAGLAPALAALAAASLLLVTRRLRPERVFREIDWSLLVFFSGLFVVTGAVESSGLAERLFDAVRPLATGGVVGLTVLAAMLSNLVSNVPAVLLVRPLVPALADPERAWLTLAMGTTLAGNLTLLGSVANLIVAELAAARGVRLGFGEYLRAGVPITLLTLGAGIAWLTLV